MPFDSIASDADLLFDHVSAGLSEIANVTITNAGEIGLITASMSGKVQELAKTLRDPQKLLDVWNKIEEKLAEKDKKWNGTAAGVSKTEAVEGDKLPDPELSTLVRKFKHEYHSQSVKTVLKYSLPNKLIYAGILGAAVGLMKYVKEFFPVLRPLFIIFSVHLANKAMSPEHHSDARKDSNNHAARTHRMKMVELAAVSIDTSHLNEPHPAHDLLVKSSILAGTLLAADVAMMFLPKVAILGEAIEERKPHGWFSAFLINQNVSPKVGVALQDGSDCLIDRVAPALKHFAHFSLSGRSFCGSIEASKLVDGLVSCTVGYADSSVLDYAVKMGISALVGRLVGEASVLVQKKVIEPHKELVMAPVRQYLISPMTRNVFAPLQQHIIDPVREQVVTPLMRQIVDTAKVTFVRGMVATGPRDAGERKSSVPALAIYRDAKCDSYGKMTLPTLPEGLRHTAPSNQLTHA